MEIVKANLHMERSKCSVSAQITLEEDRNISDRNPDAAGILMEKADILIEEIRPGKDAVGVKGKLGYELLYFAEEDDGRLCRLTGEIPFEEKVRGEGIDSIDTVEVIPYLEDIRSGLINSRKISIRALIRLEVKDEQLFDEEIPVEIRGREELEIKKERLSQSATAVNRRDIFRIKEELLLPAGLPPVEELLWHSLDPVKWEARPLEDSIGIQGEFRVFVLYAGEGEERPVKSYEAILPFSANLPCPGSRSAMLAEITPAVASRQLTVKEDYDGEARALEAEMVLELPIHLSETKEWEMITDVYGLAGEVKAAFTPGFRKIMRDKMVGKVKLSQGFSPSLSGGRLLQIGHIQAKLLPLEVTASENSLTMEGVAAVTILYMTTGEGKPYDCIRGEIPYSYTLENLPLTEDSFWKVTQLLEHCDGVLLDGETLEVKLTVGLEIYLGERWKQPVLSGLELQPLSPEKAASLPGIVAYYPRQDEELWEVGKKYMVSLASIRQLNELTSDTLNPGGKILLVK